MKPFFLALEILTPLFAVYLIYKKKDLAVVYLPLLLFSGDLIERSLSASIGYLVLTSFILYLAFWNLTFLKRNIFAIILIFYFFLLMPGSSDLVRLRPYFFASIWLFLTIPLVHDIYLKSSRNAVFKELSDASAIALVLFVISTVISTVVRYTPLGEGFYGASSGIWYGALDLDTLNVLPFFVFVCFRRGLKDKIPLYMLIALVASFLILLTFRRTVMVLTVVGVVFVMIELLNFNQIKEFLIYGLILGLVSLFAVYQTGFIDQFWERYEMRDLESRGVQEEPRFLEFEMIYKDMFVHFDYSPWFGDELFNSTGNYGKGRLGVRALHTDFGTLMHGSGIIGFTLYLLMVTTAYVSSLKVSRTRNDFLQLFFCCLAFAAYFMAGRWYTVSATAMMYCVLFLPLAGREIETGLNTIRRLNKRQVEVS